MHNYKSKFYIAAAFVALTTVVVFLPALQNGFVNWDDKDYIFENFYIRSLDLNFFRWAFSGFYAGNWHPLTWISHAVDYAFWGLNPLGHHLTSVLIHGLNTLFVVLVVKGLLEAAIDEGRYSNLSDNGILAAAVATGLVFGLHPIHVESVAWVSERKDVLCAFFFLLSILAYIKFVRNVKEVEIVSKLLNRHYLISMGLFFLSLLSKPMAVTLPAVLLIMDWYPLRRFRSGWEVFIEKTPFFLLSFASIAITVLAQHSGGAIVSIREIPLSERILVSFKALIVYIGKMLWPAKLMPFYPHPLKAFLLSFEYIFPLILVIGITAICIFLRRQRIWLAVWSYYVITLLPVLGIIQVGLQAMADRYTYLPSIGPFLLAGLGMAWISERLVFSGRFQITGKVVIYSFVLILLTVALSYSTIGQIGIWKNDIALWSKVIEIEPNIPMAYVNRGDAYAKSGRFDEALNDYTEAIKLRLRGYPNY